MTVNKENGYKRFFAGRRRRWIVIGVGSLMMLIAFGIYAIVTDLSLVASLHTPVAEHLDQQALDDLVASGQGAEAFETAFEHGDKLFEDKFNALDGVGANVGNGQRFTRIPRADLTGSGQWANHFPFRETGPNAESCTGCHNLPSDDGAGGAVANVHRDPFHSGVMKKFIERNTPHTFGGGAVQRLAEEMTEQLKAIRTDGRNFVCSHGGSVTKSLNAKGVDFGTIKISRVGTNPCRVSYGVSNVKGVSSDLIVRPFQWKGSVAFLRDFNRGAAHNELGMEASEIAGDGVDGDFDGVSDELTVGDITALSVYLGAQPRPTTLLELQSWNLIDPLPQDQVDSINRGQIKFAQIGCNSCHMSVLKIANPIFSEPSQDPDYRDPDTNRPSAPSLDIVADAPTLEVKDRLIPDVTAPARTLSASLPILVDLTKDQPDNQIKDANGNLIFPLGALRKDTDGQAMVELYGDLKRHYMGSGLAEGVDEVGTGPAVFLTENLWGVGTTAPYLHDGRATTLTEAILEHGGESLASKNAFRNLPTSDQKDVINFLNNLVLFKMQ